MILHSTPLNEFKAIIGEVIDEKLRNFRFEQPQQMESQPAYLTRKEVCTLLKISLSTLHFYVKDGTLKGFRIGGHILFKKEDIEESVKAIQTIKYKRRS